MIRGRKVVTAPSPEPHAAQRVRLDRLLAQHLQPGYEVVRALAREGTAAEIEAIEARERQAAFDDGQRAMMLRLLGVRFGEVPEAARAQILAASGERLASWAERMLAVRTLDELLAG